MKIYFAAYETQKASYKIELPGDSNLFLTYFYQKKVDDQLPELKPKGHSGIITIDSGAHSFFEQMGVSVTGKKDKKGKKAIQDPEVYFQKYVEWIKKWYDYIDYYVELDLQEVVGQKRVTEWRQMLYAEGIYKKCITVHHSCNTEREYDALLESSLSGYIGLEGIRPGFKMLPYNSLLKKAYDAKIKVHGFAFTRPELLSYFPFYSVDSSSWTTCVRFGRFQIFNGGSLVTVLPIKDHFLRHGPPLIMHNSFRKPTEVKIKEEYACEHYIKIQNHFTELWNYRGINWERQLHG